MFNVRTMNGNIIPLDFDIMTDKELDDLENSVSFYKKERKKENIRKGINTIINCIEAEIKKCPALESSTAIMTAEENFDWFDLLGMIRYTCDDL